MQQVPFTRIPNEVLDTHLKHLKACELKVLLWVMRKTIGFRKRRDWISRSQLEKGTGLSRRSITQALEGLTRNNLIQITDSTGRRLDRAVERKGKSRLYFAPAPGTCAKKDPDMRKKCVSLAQKLRITKEISTIHC